MSKRNLIGLPMTAIPTPALVVDIEIMERNIKKMMDYLDKTGVKIRPHAKSHKTPMIGHMQIKAGSIGLCCATVGEAEEMVYGGMIPSHCCSTVNLYSDMYIIRNGIVEAIWPITARGIY